MPTSGAGPSAAPGRSAAPAVEARGLGHVWASGRRGVEDVDLAVAPGERAVVMGPNGSGKSTLHRLLTGELDPTTGSATVLGRPARDPGAPVRRRTGVAGDGTVHLDPLTGRENALLFARAHGLDAASAAGRVEGLMARFDLEDVADVPVAEYSLGMRRKLLLVEALAHEPDVLLLDEPTLGLDPPALRALASLLEEAAARGGASVVATNDVGAAPSLADRIVFLDGGRVVADAPPADLLASVEGGVSVRVEAHPGGQGLRDPEALLADAGVPVEEVAGAEASFSARLPGGSGDVPRLLAALVGRGVPVRRVEIREPDLADVFRLLTGRDMEAGRREGR